MRDAKLSKLHRILIYFTAVCFVLNVGCVYTHISGGGHLDGFITFFPAVLLFILIITRRVFPAYKINGAAKLLAFLIVYLVLFVILSGSNLRNSLAELALIIVLIAYYILFEKGEKPYILIAYRDIIFIIAIISLFFWVFGSLLGLLSPSGVVTSNWGVSGGGQYNQLKSYYGLYYELDRTFIFGRFITCNRSIFVERSFASFAFSIGLLYDLFIEKNKSKLRLIVFFAAMASTLSMTGLIVMIITSMLYYLFNGTNYRIVNLIRIMFIPVVVGLVWISIEYLLDTKFSMGHSGISRISDFRNGFEAWKKSVLWGYGYGNSGEIHSMFRTGYSNSITMILTQGGIMLSLWYLIPFCKGIYTGIRSKSINFSIYVIIVIISFSFTAIAFTNIMIYLLLYFAYGPFQFEITNSEMEATR